jgi:hypothetical protein
MLPLKLLVSTVLRTTGTSKTFAAFETATLLLMIVCNRHRSRDIGRRTVELLSAHGVKVVAEVDGGDEVLVVPGVHRRAFDRFLIRENPAH